MRPALFGVTIPDGASRVVIRPVLGPGGSQPLYEGRLEVGAEPTETQVRADVARNHDFWAYIDSKVRARKIAAPRDGEWNWKCKLQFFNQLNSEEAMLTEGTHEFYRTAAPESGAEGSAEARFAQLCTEALKLVRSVTKAHARSLKKVTAAATDALAKVAEATGKSVSTSASAATTALAEATKQTAVVSELARAMQTETIELKDAIFGLQAKATQSRSEPKSMAQDLKDAIEMGKTMVGLADTVMGPTPTNEATAPTSGSGKPAGVS